METITDDKVPSHSLPIVLLFGSQICGGCRPAKEMLERTAQELRGRIEVRYVDTWSNHHLANEFDIRGLPASIVLDGQDRFLKMFVGYPPNAKELGELIPELLPG